MSTPATSTRAARPPREVTSKQDIDTALAAALALGEGCPDHLADAMRYAVLGPGKRLRPRLVLMACELCGGDPTDAMPAACAVEMIHAYSLIHDDLPAMDDDDLRRGRPTVHRKFDEATAILAGDALLALAFETLVWPPTPVQIAAPACRELAHAAGPRQLVGGQADDLRGAFEGATADDLCRIHARKTGAMITVSLRLGAMVAAATPEQLQSITEFGESLGLLFQVTDDLLDAEGDEQAVGKRVGKDIECGKLTYPALMGVEASRELARELAERACESLESFGEAAGALVELTRSIADRNR